MICAGQDEESHERLLHTVVVGGGPTGEIPCRPGIIQLYIPCKHMTDLKFGLLKAMIVNEQASQRTYISRLVSWMENLSSWILWERGRRVFSWDKCQSVYTCVGVEFAGELCDLLKQLGLNGDAKGKGRYATQFFPLNLACSCVTFFHVGNYFLPGTASVPSEVSFLWLQHGIKGPIGFSTEFKGPIIWLYFKGKEYDSIR